jgi:hypothetical protein
MVPFAAAGPEGTNPLTTSDPFWGSAMLNAMPTPHCARWKSVWIVRSAPCSLCGRDVARNSTDEGGIAPGLDLSSMPSCRQLFPFFPLRATLSSVPSGRQWFPFFPLRATAKNHAHQTPPHSSPRCEQRTRAHAALECAAHLQNRRRPVLCSTQAPRTFLSGESRRLLLTQKVKCSVRHIFSEQTFF